MWRRLISWLADTYNELAGMRRQSSAPTHKSPIFGPFRCTLLRKATARLTAAPKTRDTQRLSERAL